MKHLYNALLLCSLFFMGSVHASFPVKKGPPPLSSQERSDVMFRLVPGAGVELGNIVRQEVEKVCKGRNYAGAAYLDVETTSSSLKSISAAPIYLVSFECYR